MILIASEFSVNCAIKLTSLLKFSLETVGATILAIGTSLPELTLAITAVKKKEYSLAIGNSLGSVLEQGTLLLGLLAFASDKPINIVPLRMLAPFMFLSFVILGFGILKRKKLTRIHGAIMVFVFVMFLVYQLIWVR